MTCRVDKGLMLESILILNLNTSKEEIDLISLGTRSQTFGPGMRKQIRH